MAPTSLPTRLAGVLVGVLALVLAGCSPITTQGAYAASDGARAELADQVRAENLLIVAAAEGDPGVLAGGVTNLGSTPTTVSVSVGEQTVELPIEAGHTVLLGAPDAQESATMRRADVIVEAVPGPPGSLVPVALSTPESGSMTVSVPVLDGTLPEYAALLPTLVPETPDAAPGSPELVTEELVTEEPVTADDAADGEEPAA